jgi:beta-lactamase superfamily II metal-dependent hydrolase
MAKRARSKKLAPHELGVVVLNVGDGDAIVVRFPPAHNTGGATDRVVGAVIDCFDGKKTIDALKRLGIDELAFVCATHPHADHIQGMQELIQWCLDQGKPVQQYWDSGFRHVSVTQYRLIRLLTQNPDIRFIQPTSGYECIINHVRVQVLSPSIVLKNRYDTFGTNINNASVVIKLEYPAPDIAQRYVAKKDAEAKRLSRQELLKQNTIILGADAQFDAWARITEEFPTLQRTANPGQLIDPRHIHRPLHCQVLKVPHHMSKHSASLEVLETINPSFIIASCDNNSHYGFPHQLTVLAAEDIKHGKGPKGWIRFTGHREKAKRSGSVLTVLKGQGKPSVRDLGDSKTQMAPL